MSIDLMLNELVERRAVRAVARVGSHGLPHAWKGSVPQLLVVDRRVEVPTQEVRSGVVLHLFPYEALEQGSFPLDLLAEARAEYDPTRLLGKHLRQLPTLNGAQLRQQATSRLKALQLHKQADFIHALLVAREVVVQCIVPMHLQPTQHFHSDCRFPEHLQNRLSLTRPAVLTLLDDLFALNHPEEASALLGATRGMGLTAQEKRARMAVESGFLRGSIFYLRQESVKGHADALQQWTHLSHSRRERLSHLWGLERAPLGWVAINRVLEFLEP